MRLPENLRGWAAPVAGAAAPWAWFAARDTTASFDEVAVFLPAIVLLGIVAVTAVAARKLKPALAVVAASLVVFGALVVLGPRMPIGGPAPIDPVHLVSSNAYDHNPSPAQGVRNLLDRNPDVLVAVETTPLFRVDLFRSFPYRAENNAIGVFSDWPLALLPNPEGIPTSQAIRVQVAAPSGSFVLYAVHASNPLHDTSFGAALVTVQRIKAAAASERLPVVLAGDFNETDRSQAYRTLASAFRDAMRAGWAGSTYEKGIFRLFQLRIDNVFITRTWCAADAATFPVSGSDHEALDVRVGPCPEAVPGS